MAQEKLQPCCANYVTQLSRARADQKRTARAISNAIARNRDATKLKAQIPVLKQQIQELEANQVDHEAMHAGEVVPA